jgi:hypothetical protein
VLVIPVGDKILPCLAEGECPVLPED